MASGKQTQKRIDAFPWLAFSHLGRHAAQLLVRHAVGDTRHVIGLAAALELGAGSSRAGGGGDPSPTNRPAPALDGRGGGTAPSATAAHPGLLLVLAGAGVGLRVGGPPAAAVQDAADPYLGGVGH